MTFLETRPRSEPIAERLGPPPVAMPAPGFTLLDLVKTLFYHRRAVLVALAVPPLLSIVVALGTHTAYVADARLLVLPGGEYSYHPQVGQASPETTLTNAQTVQSEVEILNDNGLVARTLDVLGPARVLGAYDPSAPNAMAVAVRTAASDLKVISAPLTNAITVTYRSRDPQVAADFVNTLIKAYLAQRLEVYQRTPYASLAAQRDQFLGRLRDAETQLAQFGEAHHITNLDDQLQLLLRQQVELTQQQRSTAARISADAAQLDQIRREQARTPRTTQMYTEQSRTPGADQSGIDLAKLQARREQMAANYQPGSVLLRDVDRQIALLQGSIARTPGRDVAAGRSGPNPLWDQLAAQAANVEAERQGLRASLASLDAQADQMQARLSELNEAGRQYRVLKGNRDVLETTQQTFSKNSEEAQLNDALERTREANVRVVQEAQPPPSGTSLRSLIVLAGAFLGVAAAGATLLVLTAMRQVVIDPVDAERRMHLPVLAVVSDRRDRPPRRPTNPARGATARGRVPGRALRFGAAE